MNPHPTVGAAICVMLSRVGLRVGRSSPVGLLLALLAFTSVCRGAETLPPPPARHFNDYAGVVSPTASASLDRELEQFERDTSNQLVVAVFQRMNSQSTAQDYSFRIAQSWRVGMKGRDNGAVLFVFLENHEMYIQVGYGLEPVLTDATCFQIIENEIKPRFRTNDFTGGLQAGVHAMMSATRGEYKGTGRTQAEARHRNNGFSGVPVIFFVIVMLIVGSFSRRGNRVYRRGGWGGGGFGPGGGLGGFGGFGGGGGSSGGGFSGGGGNFGGGGAGGRW